MINYLIITLSDATFK